jgi:hypothetical protein
MSQEKLLSEQKGNDLEFIQKQKHLEINEVVITKNVIEVKAVNDNDWDDYDWYPDSH